MLAVAAIVMPPNPTITISRTDTEKRFETASRTSASPRAMAPPTMRPTRGRPPDTASQAAAISEPTPDAVIRKP